MTCPVHVSDLTRSHESDLIVEIKLVLLAFRCQQSFNLRDFACKELISMGLTM